MRSKIVSVICTVILILLGASEIKTYLEPSTTAEIFTQSSHASDTFKINIDIVMPKMPCDIIGLDLEDQLGNHISDYYGELHKHRLSEEGESLSIESWKEKNENRKVIADRIEAEVKAKQGCRLEGFIETVRAPGNFRISHHAFMDILMHLSM